MTGSPLEIKITNLVKLRVSSPFNLFFFFFRFLGEFLYLPKVFSGSTVSTINIKGHVFCFRVSGFGFLSSLNNIIYFKFSVLIILFLCYS